jgi:NhaP-type Na+/H+ or K+/H+ antiporter
MQKLRKKAPGKPDLLHTALVDVVVNAIAGILFVAVIGWFGLRGVTLLEGWQLVALIALISVTTIFVIVAIARRRLRMKGKLARDRSIEADLD